MRVHVVRIVHKAPAFLALSLSVRILQVLVVSVAYLASDSSWKISMSWSGIVGMSEPASFPSIASIGIVLIPELADGNVCIGRVNIHYSSISWQWSFAQLPPRGVLIHWSKCVECLCLCFCFITRCLILLVEHAISFLMCLRWILCILVFGR